MSPEDSIDYFDKVINMVDRAPFDPQELSNILESALQVVDDVEEGYTTDLNIELLCTHIKDIAKEWSKRI